MRSAPVVLILVMALAAAFFILTYETPSEGESTQTVTAPSVEDVPKEEVRLQVVSWNLLNFGGSKDDQEVAFMADLLQGFDVVAVQEVITSPEGAQAVARLDDELDRRGAAWDYVISEPTVGPGSERYAFLWKPSKARLVGQPWLEASLAESIDREPFMARFETVKGGQRLLIASLHAVPTAKRPADEVVLLDDLHHRYLEDNLMVLGDFNLSEGHEAFDDLKQAGYQPALVEQKTSIRMRKKDGEHLANEYDNIFFEAASLQAAQTGVVDFTTSFRTLEQARDISDHLPVFMEVQWH